MSMSLTTSKLAYLPNPFYSALISADAPFALIHGRARRFRSDTIPFAAVSEPSVEALKDLTSLLTYNEEIYITAEVGEALDSTNSLEIISTFPGLQMRFNAASPPNEESVDVVTLAREGTEEMLQLKARAFPGLFGPRAAELGSFFGIREPETGRLVARACY
jgi:hypothetical protein